jgi:hypothetical protein
MIVKAFLLSKVPHTPKILRGKTYFCRHRVVTEEKSWIHIRNPVVVQIRIRIKMEWKWKIERK